MNHYEPPRILILGQDADLRDLLAQYLVQAGFSATAVADQGEMDAQLAQGEPDLILLDLNSPEEDGLSLARRLVQERKIPILILSDRGEEQDRIAGLETGADDYIVKPFNPRELLARIRAVLRCRCGDSARETQKHFVSFGPYRFDLQRRILSKDGEPIPLTTSEIDLLQLLVQHPHEILDRDTLADLRKGYERSPFDRSIDVLIARLRAKIEPDTKHPRYIRTVWGKGYFFTPEGSEVKTANDH